MSVRDDFRRIQTAAGERLREDERQAAVRECRKAKELDWPLGSPHDLRKTFCTHAAARLPLHVLKHYAGHASIQTTAAYYLRTTPDDADKLRAAMAG